MIFLLYSNNLLVTRAPRKGSQMDYVKTALIYLSENISNEVNLDDIARQANISRYYLIKIFKDVVGQTPMEYLNNLRMEKAATLLMDRFAHWNAEPQLFCPALQAAFSGNSQGLPAWEAFGGPSALIGLLSAVAQHIPGAGRKGRSFPAAG